jgi:hypothetical protein
MKELYDCGVVESGPVSCQLGVLWYRLSYPGSVNINRNVVIIRFVKKILDINKKNRIPSHLKYRYRDLTFRLITNSALSGSAFDSSANPQLNLNP